ncbi:hypothetical protein [Falsiroseomonas sp.]|uniref:hypothetical protein n=1 Tax=Falsiroseomonas sp. TaxID=2870721 RepID=UPI0035649C59
MPGTQLSAPQGTSQRAGIRPMPPPAPAAAEGAVEGALHRALRQAIRQKAGGVVLRIEEPAPHRRRVARALLQEGALVAGGQVVDGPGGDLLLVGAAAARAERLRALLERLVGPAASQLFSLERDRAALLAYAAGGGLAAPEKLADGPGLAGLDGFLDSLPLARAVRRTTGVLVTDGSLRPAFLRLEAGRAEIATLLGALGSDADLLDHAVHRISLRLLAALADPAEARKLLGPARPPRLHLPLPELLAEGGAGPPAPPGRLVATLPLAALADPPALAAREAALQAAGIALELDGLDAASLALLSPASLPASLLRLHWSPALAEPAALAALRELDPARLVLAGAGTEAAIGFATALGISLIEAPAS